MKLRFAFVVLMLSTFTLVLAPKAQGAIAFRASTNCHVAQVNPAFSCTGPAMAVSTGDTIVVFIYSPANVGGTGITDDCGNSGAYVAQPNSRLNIWTRTNAVNTSGTANCTLTASHASGGSSDPRFSFIAASYSGVSSVAQPTNGPQGTFPTGLVSMTLVTQEAGNFIVAGIGQNASNPAGAPGTIQSNGNVRAINNNGTQGMADLLVPTAGSGTITITYTPVTTYIYTGFLELRVAGASGGTATQFQQNHTVLLPSVNGANYNLPAAGLSSTWCAYVMPTGPPQNPFNITRLGGGTFTLNGLNSNLTIYPWQMTRVCRDDNGNYWASPPLVAGANITITPSASAITISATGGGGGGAATSLQFGTSALPLSTTAPVSGEFLSYDGTNIVGTPAPTPPAGLQVIASGTTTFAAQTIAAGTCTSINQPSSPNVLQTDIIIASLNVNGNPSTPGVQLLEPWFWARNGLVMAQLCNTTANPITTTAGAVFSYKAVR